MKIIIGEKYKEVIPSEGCLLYLDGMTFEGLCCPLDVNAEATYIEVKEEDAEEICNKYLEAHKGE